MRNRKDAGVRRARTLHLPVEGLERRALMSGNVLAVQAGTILTLAGDNLANEVMVRSGNAPDVIVVDGLAQTLVNGSNQPLEFTGVRRLDVTLGGGDDWFKGTDFNLNTAAFGQVNIDAGNGDDRVELKNTTIFAAASVPVSRPSITIRGDNSTAQSEPTTGNDTIQVANTRIVAEGASATQQSMAALTIYGDYNIGGEITGGNDSIMVTDTEMVAGGARSQAVSITIYGDYNVADPGASSTIGGGNDSISVTNTGLTSSGAALALNSTTITIEGDYNDARGSAAAGSTASVGGGNDSISVTNVNASSAGNSRSNLVDITVRGTGATAALLAGPPSATGPAVTSTVGGGNDAISIANVSLSTADSSTGDTSRITVSGDEALATDVAPGDAVTSIGGGNDSITLDNVDATAAGGVISDRVDIEITGDLTSAFAQSGGAARVEVGGGNDDIAVRNSTFTADDESARAVIGFIEIRGEAGAFDGTGVPASVGEGDDRVSLRNVQLSALFGRVTVDTLAGDDELDVQNSSFGPFFASLGEGDDAALFNANTFITAELDGGPGYDVLSAHNNVGVLTFSNFEEENITP